MAHRRRIEVTLTGGPSDGKKVVVNVDTDEYRDSNASNGAHTKDASDMFRDPDASSGVYIKDASGVFRWEES